MILKFVTLSLLTLTSLSQFNSYSETIDSSTKKAEKSTLNNYIIDPVHSRISFEVAHLVVSSVTGDFKKFEGSFTFNPQDFTKTTLKASADATSIDTGLKQRDDHLRSPDFFDSKKHPKLTFVSTSAKKTGENTFDLLGDITIRGVTKPTVFHVTYKGEAKMDEKLIQAFKATATINRQDFNVKFQNVADAGPVVGDEVTIIISIEGKKI